MQVELYKMWPFVIGFFYCHKCLRYQRWSMNHETSSWPSGAFDVIGFFVRLTSGAPSLFCSSYSTDYISFFSGASFLSFSPLNVGEPQGSVFRPLLFFTFIPKGPSSDLMGFHHIYMPSAPKFASPAWIFIIHLFLDVNMHCKNNMSKMKSWVILLPAFQFVPPLAILLVAQTKNFVITLDFIFLTCTLHLSASPAGLSFKNTSRIQFLLITFIAKSPWLSSKSKLYT